MRAAASDGNDVRSARCRRDGSGNEDRLAVLRRGRVLNDVARRSRPASSRRCCHAGPGGQSLDGLGSRRDDLILLAVDGDGLYLRGAAGFRFALHVGDSLFRVLQVVQDLAIRRLPDQSLSSNGFGRQVAEVDVGIGVGGRVNLRRPDGQARSEKIKRSVYRKYFDSLQKSPQHLIRG